MSLNPFNTAKAGIELSAEHISAALVRKKGGLNIVKDLTENVLPSGLIIPAFKKENISDVHALKESLVQIRQTLGCKKISIALPDSSVKIIIKKFDQLPPDAKSTEKMIRWEITSSLNLNAEDIRISWQEMGMDPNGNHTFLVALAMESVISQYESAFSMAALKPLVIAPSGLNQFNFYAQGIQGLGNTAYLGMFDELVNIFVFSGDIPVFYKTIKKGMLGEKGMSAINDVDLLIQYYHSENPDIEIERFYVASAIKSEAQIRQILHEEPAAEVEILNEDKLVRFDDNVQFESDNRPLAFYASVIGTAQGI